MEHLSYFNLLQLEIRLSLWRQLFPLTRFYLNHVKKYMNIVTTKREHKLPFIAG